jgi:hypothetical protein
MPDVTSFDSLVNGACTVNTSRKSVNVEKLRVGTAKSIVTDDRVGRTDSVAGVIIADNGSNLNNQHPVQIAS